jgi:hypothetical protein
VAQHGPSWTLRRVDPRVTDALRVVAAHDPHPAVHAAAQAALRRMRPGLAHRTRAAGRVGPAAPARVR